MFNWTTILKRRTFLQIIAITGLSVKSRVLDFNLTVKEKLNIFKKIDISGESTEGGVISCLVSNNNLSKVNIEQCWESGKHIIIMLLKNNKIIRVDETIIHYNVPFYIDKSLAEEIGSSEYFDDQKSTVVTSSYFFRGDKIVQFSTSLEEGMDSVEIQKLETAFNNRVQFILRSIRGQSRLPPDPL